MLHHQIFRKKKGEKETLPAVILLAYFVVINIACMSRSTQQKKKNVRCEKKCDFITSKYE